jgi:two-component system phosphate regulon response regulator PhoB
MGFIATLAPETVNEIASAVAAAVVEALVGVRAEVRIDSREVIKAGQLVIDAARHEARFDDKILNLKPQEFELLATLARNAGRALSRRQLIEMAWPYPGDVGSERTVDVHVRRLRNNLGASATIIQTVGRVGYMLDAPP